MNQLTYDTIAAVCRAQEAVLTAAADAESEELLTWASESMSNKRVRLLHNAIATYLDDLLPDLQFIEAGTYDGRGTVIIAYGNEANGQTVDSLSGFMAPGETGDEKWPEGGQRGVIEDNLNAALISDRVKFYHAELPYGDGGLIKGHQLIYYDIGKKTEQVLDHLKVLMRFAGEVLVLVVDDFDNVHVRNGVEHAEIIYKNYLSRAYYAHLPGRITQQGEDDGWWNGVGIMVYERIKPAQ
jgi:hypothetical protein